MHLFYKKMQILKYLWTLHIVLSVELDVYLLLNENYFVLLMSKIVETPMLKQYNAVKKQHPDALLLYRCGDFYETYGEDAVTASAILGITLTMRGKDTSNEIRMAGFPYHAIDTYLPKLVRAGWRVAICDQLEDPKLAKGIVKRGVTELVTPGVSYNDNVLENKSNNFVACLHFGKSAIGLAFLDISTGEFLLTQGVAEYVSKLIGSFAPKEVLYEYGKKQKWEDLSAGKYFTFQLDDWMFTTDAANNRLKKQFDVLTLKGFGVDDLPEGVIAAGGILHYLDATQHLQTAHITNLKRIEGDSYVWMDKFTIRNLELYGSMNGEGKSFISILDKTLTPMGGRLLKRWLAFPLKSKTDIEKRQNVVEAFFKDTEIKRILQEKLPLIGDLERIVSKIAVSRINPRELMQLRTALFAIQEIKEICTSSQVQELSKIVEGLDLCLELRDRIEKEINDDPPMAVNKGGVIRQGINADLDEYRRLAYSGKDYLLQIQQRESDATGIPSLKISYNNVFGYYIEVRNAHKDKVPQEWIRKQTLVNAERYITQELKEYEEKILGAEEKVLAIENQLFSALVTDLAGSVAVLQKDAVQIARLDVLCSFALVAAEGKYIRPLISDDDVLDIRQGRHPVIERQMPIGEEYIANDVYLDSNKQQIIIITGPNMAGKSALLRQTALITIMAQIGSFVPAESAQIGVVDKIFTRVGASDNISMGESTFMVEMNEAASILNNLSDRSLILFDELGRGTSTYDGISIAWSIVEYIHEHPTAKARTLFATHYHELNEMEKDFKRIKNYNVSVKEIDGKVIFLRKLIPGGSEHSFGIHVAKLAGMPKSIVKRAGDILLDLENKNQDNRKVSKKSISKSVSEIAEHREGYQLSIFKLDDPVLSQVRDEILNVDVNNLTPLEALNKLSDIKKILKGK